MSDAYGRSFPFKDLARRKFQTGLTILSLTLCVSLTVFLVLFGEILGFEVTLFTRSGLTVGFSDVYSTFILAVVILNSAAGILVAYFLMSITTPERVRDIGLMKAIGCLTEVAYDYLTTELLIIVIAGCTLGTIGGIVLNLASVGIMNLLGFRISAKLPNPWLIIGILFVFIFVSYILGIRRIIKAAGVEPAKALSPIFILKTERQPILRFPFPSVGGFIAKMAFRDLGRRKLLTLQSVACLSMIITLITLAVVGGITANETTQSYVERAIGRDVILIAKDEVAEQYKNNLEKFFGTSEQGQIDYLDEKYMIPGSLISDLEAINGVAKVDPRLIMEVTVNELKYIGPDPEDPYHYIVIGDDRSDKALIIGVHAEKLVSDWLILGEKLVEDNRNGGLIGDSLAFTLFQDPWRQSFKVNNTELKVAGVCLDPLNNGKVIYVPFNRLSSIFNHTGYNVLLLQIDPSDSSSYSRILSEIEARISGFGLTLLDLNEILGRQKAYLNNIWSLMLSLSLFSFVNAVLSLMGYLMLSISSQQRDLGITRALGAKPKTVVKVILLETFLLVSASGIVGLPIGIIIAFWFFIPEAVISLTATLSIAVLLSVLMGILCLSSLYPAGKIAKASITRIM